MCNNYIKILSEIDIHIKIIFDTQPHRNKIHIGDNEVSVAAPQPKEIETAGVIINIAVNYAREIDEQLSNANHVKLLILSDILFEFIENERKIEKNETCSENI